MKTSNYYVITATLEGETVELFGSFDKNDCKYELDCNKQQWKGEGHKSIMIATKQVDETPAIEVYGTNFATGRTLHIDTVTGFECEVFNAASEAIDSTCIEVTDKHGNWIEEVGCWFEDGELVDYDGVMCLEPYHRDALIKAGYSVSEDFID